MTEPDRKEELELRYVPLSAMGRWDGNPKAHDLETLRTLIRRDGFKDPPKFEPTLNGGGGGLGRG